MNPFQINKKKIPNVLFPQLLEEDIYCGKLLGYSHPNTSIYNVVCSDEFLDTPIKKLSVIGQIVNINDEGKYFNYIINIEEDSQVDNSINFIDKPVVEFGQLLAVRNGKSIEFFTSEELKCKSESE